MRRCNWGEDRVYFHDDTGRLRAMPTTWTSANTADPVVVLGAGRSPFLVSDLLELAELLQRLRSGACSTKGRRRRGNAV
jgi:hypothetical protein